VTTRHHRDGGGWETAAGYARAVRRGNRIEVSGTTVPGLGPDAERETGRQAHAAITQGLAAVTALGGVVADVVRTRIFLAPGAVWQEAGEAHAALLGHVAPANTTLYVAGLIGDSLVEVEIEAEVVHEPDAGSPVDVRPDPEDGA
jgi:enamine deaminase RidA (YjgF/YER057c/UK114 family)